jgi:hypothetical protein
MTNEQRRMIIKVISTVVLDDCEYVSNYEAEDIFAAIEPIIEEIEKAAWHRGVEAATSRPMNENL